jgi:hypothetical protein
MSRGTRGRRGGELTNGRRAPTDRLWVPARTERRCHRVAEYRPAVRKPLRSTATTALS